MRLCQEAKICSRGLFPVLFNVSYPEPLPGLTLKSNAAMVKYLVEAYSHGEEFIKVSHKIGTWMNHNVFLAAKTTLWP